ncbi:HYDROXYPROLINE-RICH GLYCOPROTEIN FAMILY PROTEIN [Salix viminalis]|uniref:HYDROXYPROLINE-RICH GLYCOPROTEIN FAMILY PROTEIN n=1 Tax=Salix viminalis TaxID=40686 RepID=A0A9Q0QJX7_SALVM|nr:HYDROXYPROLINE-RICH GLYCOPROTEIN FAMILY PROTEIN [Salix viminalis]
MKNQQDLGGHNQETSTKRKHSSNSNNSQDLEEFKIQNEMQDEDEDEFGLALSLSFRPTYKKKTTSNTTKPQLSLSLPPSVTSTLLPLSTSHALLADIPLTEPLLYTTTASVNQESPLAGPSRGRRKRRNPSQGPREGKGETVPVLYSWAMDRRATVRSLEYLLSRKIETITGLVQCKRCEKQYEIGFDLEAKFVEIGAFISENKSSMRDRAPSVWMNPALPKCQFCEQENSAKPVIANKKRKINWLFLLLGQMLGCCTLDQLKYFCKHTKNHRTGAKDRVLFLAYLGLCKQLDPNGPFDR